MRVETLKFSGTGINRFCPRQSTGYLAAVIRASMQAIDDQICYLLRGDGNEERMAAGESDYVKW